MVRVIEDLHKTRDMSMWWNSEQRRELVYFTVKINELDMFDIPNTKGIKDFLKKGYFDLGEEFCLTPGSLRSGFKKATE